MVHHPCIGYAVIFSDEAKKDMKRLDQKVILKIFDKTKKIVSSELDSLNIKKLKSRLALYRLRIGDYRVVYHIQHDKIVVCVVAVGHRSDIYALLDRRLGL